MKTDSHNPKVWSAESDRQFSTSKLGKKISRLLREGTTSQRQLSEFTLRDPVFVATRGIEDLSQITGVSTSTISRYARDLGVASFAEFRAAVGNIIGSLIAPVSKLNETMSDDSSRNGAVERSLASAAVLVAQLQETETANRLKAASRKIGSANRVYVVGFGLSAHLAAMLTLGLQPYRENVVNIAQYGGTESAAARLASSTTGDLVVAISFPRYSKDAVEMVRFARERGAEVIALTDSTASPISEYANELLLAPAQHPVISSSSVPGLVLIEALVSEFLISDPENLKKAERLASAIATYLAGSG
ncbi:MurR/RpiR family transcriptional regulator [Rhizobium sp. BK399]|uniref:MurR/RpiR family transcriptional regulator n=1 Tax=Rhizobium sp. BK399 TaxID=2587063 RepID=UPI0016175A9B|nr:MurR/RpiR family transcriptional regulator [Rhizobium sp. BK399]MBB3543749.1 DNA-binding MurR/RpiR family transcriptional regulator [Rhizobium sp. BK399]